MVFPYGAIELKNNESLAFKVNSQMEKNYFSDVAVVKLICDFALDEV